MANQYTTAWPQKRTERLIALWNRSGMSAALIGDQLGVSRNAVLGKVHRLGLESHLVVSAKVKKPRMIYVKPLYLASNNPRGATTGYSAIAETRRTKRLRAHEGMTTLSISETSRMLSEPTKNELRAMLAEAVRNTAALQTAESSI